MTHRLVLGLLFLSLLASAQPAEKTTGDTLDSWSFSSDEGGGGNSYMGVDISDVTAERLSELKLKEEHGAEITMVDEDAPAGKAGLHEHDVILSVNGSPVESAAQLRRMIKELPPGRVISLGISRDGQPQTIKVQLADRRKSMTWAPENHEFHFDMPQISVPDIDMPNFIGHSSVRNGIVVENLTPQLGEFFGVKGGAGVLVRSVEKGSHGEKAGFRAGDVVVKINGQPVHDSADFTHALRSSSNGSASVIVIRDKKEQTLTLTVPPKKDSGRLLEDTLDIPAISAETQLAISHADELARMGPEFMQQIQQRTKQAAEEAEQAQQRWQQAQKELEKRLEVEQKRMKQQEQGLQKRLADEQKIMQQRGEDLQRRLEDEQKVMREDQQQRMQQRGEQLRHRLLGGGWAEI